MRASLENICNDFIHNIDAVRSVYKMESPLIVHVCAADLAAKGIRADAEKLKECKKLIEKNTGFFSNFRGNVQLPLTAVLAAADDPTEKLQQTKDNYELLKQQLWSSQYLALLAAVMTDMTDTDGVRDKAERGKHIFDLMKKEHPFLTGSEDSVFAVLLAFSEKADEQLIEETEKVYDYFKKKFGGNAVQMVSHVLSLTEGSWEDKCRRMELLWDSLKNADRKYSKYYELSALAALTITDGDVNVMVDDILEADRFLEKQDSYSGIFGIDKKTRLMHAVMLISSEYSKNSNAGVASVTGTLAMVAAQQAAMCAVIAASCSSTAAASN